MVHAGALEDVQYIVRQKEIRFIINVMSILFMAAGAIYVVIIVFIQEMFHTVTKDLGILAVALGLGLFLGSVLYGKFGTRFSRFKTIFFCLILGGVMLTFFTMFVYFTHNKFIGMGLSFILGLVIGPIVIASNTIVHEICSNEMRGKVFSALEFVMHLAFLIAMFASSTLSEHYPRVYILVGVGGVFLLVGVAGLIKYRNVAR